MKGDEFKTRGLLEETGKSENLTDREKHLIGMAVTATRGCIACTGGRIEKARTFLFYDLFSKYLNMAVIWYRKKMGDNILFYSIICKK